MTSAKPPTRDRTLSLSEQELGYYQTMLVSLNSPVSVENILNKTIQQDLFGVIPYLPQRSVDLLFIDPPYNLNKSFNENHFKQTTQDTYAEWLDSWLKPLTVVLKKTASVYFCSDWRSSSAVYGVISKYFEVRNRITWEREKGRGALKNWKNCSEDIWFCTVSDDYYFDVDAVKLKRRVIAPYTDKEGKPKDWDKSAEGNYRLTHPSNLWTDLTIPFWSMPENTEHPTQKPEKLLAKIILASSRAGDIVLDPFLGSGTTSVVAKKLGRQYIGIEQDKTYCCLAEKRLDLAETDPTIQGYHQGVFWERNTASAQKEVRKSTQPADQAPGSKQNPLFDIES